MRSLFSCLFAGVALMGCSKADSVQQAAVHVRDSLQSDTAPANSITVYITKSDERKKMFKEANIGFNASATTNALITIDPSIKYQTVDGCGLALTGSSAYIISQLPDRERVGLLKELFEVGNLMSLSIVRISIGASDFSTTAYTYDDMPVGETDAALTRFNLRQHDDAKYVLPVLKEILAINPEIKIIASPWSPPAWMKRSGSLNATSETDTYTNSLMSGYRTVWANYLVKYLQALKSESPAVPVWAITVQNEPKTLKTNYPTCYMSVADQQYLVKDLRAKMDKAGFASTKILCGENNWAGYKSITDFYNDPEALAAVAGAAFHGYTDETSGGSSDEMTPIHNTYPEKELHVTEYSGNRRNAFSGELESFTVKRLINPFRNWARSVSYWNIALNQDRKPNIKIGGTDSRPALTVDSVSKEVTRNVDYYVLAHVSRFLRKGAQRIYSNIITDSNIHNVAFINPDGRKILVVYNTGDVAHVIDVKTGTDKFTYAVPEHTAVTFSWL